jgi:hypothetical protein
VAVTLGEGQEDEEPVAAHAVISGRIILDDIIDTHTYGKVRRGKIVAELRGRTAWPLALP